MEEDLCEMVKGLQSIPGRRWGSLYLGRVGLNGALHTI